MLGMFDFSSVEEVSCICCIPNWLEDWTFPGIDGATALILSELTLEKPAQTP